jgi:hypothetical protein
MGVRILTDRSSDQAVLTCSTTDWAFGPVVSDSDHHDAEERLEAFLRWLRVDPRSLSDGLLQTRYSAWRAQEADQWRLEALEEAELSDELLPSEVHVLETLRAERARAVR